MKKDKILILYGGDYHDFDACGKVLMDYLSTTGKMKPELVKEKSILSSDTLNDYEAIVIYTQGGRLTEREENGLLSFVQKGKGVLGIHCACDSFKENKRYIKMLGSEFIGHAHPYEFNAYIKNKTHFISQRLSEFKIFDELYLLKNEPDINIVLTAHWQGKMIPIVYTKSYGDGRVGYIALGHDIKAFTNYSFQKLALRSLEWVLGKEIEEKVINCGIIGYGAAFNMGKRHMNMINATSGFNAVAVCDNDSSRLEVAKNDFPGIKTHKRVDKLLNSNNIDLVVVVTPHNTHAPIAVQCLNKGKHTIVEKPMAITTEEATSMIEAAKKRNVMLSVFHSRRYDGDFLTIKEVIDKGLIGDVFRIELYVGSYGHPGIWWRSDKNISGGAFHDWGIHLVDWVLNIIPEEIESIMGFTQKVQWWDVTNEDEVESIIKFKNGTVADIQLSSVSSISKPRWRILGSKGGILDEGKGFIEIIREGGKGGNLELKYKQSKWENYYINIADHLLSSDPLAITPESARRVISVIEATGNSALSGKMEKPVFR